MTTAAARPTLRELIEQEIRARGPIPFSRFMELCLYHHEFGYYSRPQEKFGKTGDFYTASDVHAVFGRLLCRQFEEMWHAMDRPADIEIVELGPGRGLFAQDVLAWAEKKSPDFREALHYTLVESSPGLQQRLRHWFARELAEGEVDLLPELPEEKFGNAIVFGNEFFDALPVEVLGPLGRLVIDSRDGRFVEEFTTAPPELLDFIDRYAMHPGEHERVEAVPNYRAWMERISASADRGFAVFIDYGYTREQLLAGRHRGTVTSFHQHTVAISPYDSPGEQDITAHVNFTALAEIGRELGWAPERLVTQSMFLMGIGERDQFADAFSEAHLPQEQAKMALQLKHLVTPAGMGESFQVLVMSRGVEKEKAAQLSGLSFGNQRG